MPDAPPLAWPVPPAPMPPAPPDPPSRASWAPLAIIGGAAVLVALVVTLVTVLPGDEPTAAPAEVAPGTAALDPSDPGPPGTDPLTSTPPSVFDPPSTSVPALRPPRAVDLSLAELQAALLTGDDLGMAVNPETQPDTTDTIPVEDLEADVACQEALRRYDAIGFRPLFGGGPPRAPRRATVELTDGDATVEHEVGDGLQVTVADLRTLFSTCTQVGFSQGSSSGRLSIGPGPPIDVGDDSLSLQYTFSQGGPTATLVRWVLWERDSIISSVSVSEGVDDSLVVFEAAALIADERLTDVIG